ncbi:MAG: hypothetical protein H7Y22_02600 [Gemmatimonadaceae bacterium]|nr:hypothetical protein [Gloeobacterales cyanobacterium ES-bin-141]
MTRTLVPALAALAAGLLNFASPAWAVQIAFDVNSSTGEPLGSGFVDSDSAALTGTGAETLDASDGLTLSFTALAPGLSGTFSIDDDDFDLAAAQFLDGLPVGLNYLVTTASVPGGFGFASTIESLSNTSIVIGTDPGTAFGFYTGGGFGTGTLAFAEVPEPGLFAAAAVLAGAALGLGLKRRRALAKSAHSR